MTEELKSKLEELKAKYGKVTEFNVFLDTDDDTKIATIFLRKPDKSTRGIIGKLVNNGQSDKAVEAALKNLYLGGDPLESVLSNDDALASAEMGIVELLKVQSATIKKN